MGRKGKPEKHWQSVLDDPASTPERKDEAARLIAREKHRTELKKKKAPKDDPRPDYDLYDRTGESFRNLEAWKRRNPDAEDEPEPEPKKIEAPKPAPVVLAPAPVPAPAPKPVPRVRVRQLVVRESREGTSGFFYKENFWNLDKDERRGKMVIVNARPDLKSEWDRICETTCVQAPRAVVEPATEAAKRAAFSAPEIRTDALATGQVQTVDEVRTTFAPTMGNARPDSGRPLQSARPR